MIKSELIKQLTNIPDDQEVRVSLSGDPYTFGVASIDQSKLKDLTSYIRIEISNDKTMWNVQVVEY